MRIAFDLDGVLADLHGAFAKVALELYPEIDSATIGSPEVGSSPPVGTIESVMTPVQIPATKSTPLTARQTAAVWKSLLGVNNFWETLPEIEPGTVARLAALTDERGWELLFITSRPGAAGRTVQRQSQRWLQQHGFPMPSLYVVHGSRGQIAKAMQIDVVVDDRPENCLDVVLDSKAGAVLVWRGKKKSVPASARRMGIAVVPTVDACLEALVAIERSQDGGSLLDRLRRLFGLTTARSPIG